MLDEYASQTITIPTTPIPNIDIDTNQFKVMYYTSWLSTEVRNTGNKSFQEESKNYAEEASKTVTINNQEYRLFAPFRRAYSAYKTVTRGQTIVLSTILLVCVLALVLYGLKAVMVIFAIISFLYLSSLLLDFLLSLQALNQSSEEQIDDEIVYALANADWPLYTILCPLYHETIVVPQFVQAMQALDYPTNRLQILLLTEEDDVETREVLRAMHLPRHFSIVTVPAGLPQTKPRACNFGLLQAKGNFVVIYDAEDLPHPLQLKKAILTFANHGADLACVQAKLNYYNTNQNLLTRWFSAEYSLWFDLILPGMQRAKLPLPLGGTSNHFRTQLLRNVGAWDGFNVTEDCDLGLRLSSNHLKTTVLDSTTYEEANSQVKNWIRQRSRWIKGYLQTYLVYMRDPLHYLRQGRFREFFSLQLVIGGKTAVLFINPVMWLLLLLYFPLRAVLGDTYHTIFPSFILYMSALCLVAGNFFYLYSLLIACMKRGQYGLIKWALFAPVYWGMMSTAAFLALYQLIFKPHYWEKTVHGLHLRGALKTASKTIVQEDHEIEVIEQLPFPAEAEGEVTLLSTLSSSALSRAEEEDREITEKLPVVKKQLVKIGEPLFLPRPMRQARPQWFNDPWLVTTFVLACIASIAALSYSFQHHYILLFEDAFSHMSIARRMLDSLTPGLGQIGGNWLPLPHLLMLPFIWNDYLWRTGLAGSFPSMLSYLVTTIYLYLAIWRLTRKRFPSFIGALVFILNPNVLYLQTTPLSELVCIATMTMTGYYFLAWTQEDHSKYLIFAAGSTFLATLARYDGWVLFPALFIFIALIGWMKRLRWVKIEGNLIIFSVFGGLGMGLWFLWCAMLFGDPLYFQRGTYSAQAQTAVFLQTHTLATFHNFFESFWYYTLLCIDTIGPLLFLLAAISLFAFLFRSRIKPEVFAALVFLAPFCFYVLSLYTGQANLYIPQVVPADVVEKIFNVRFGVEMVAPVGLFVGLLAAEWSPRTSARIWTAMGPGLLIAIIVVQTVLVVNGGVLTLEDGLYGGACAPAHPINIYLAQHYAGGEVLENVFGSKIDGTEAGLDLKDIISESSGQLWEKALNNPASLADWIIVRPGTTPGVPLDPIAAHIDLRSPAFLSQYTLVTKEADGLSLYHRKGLPPLPTRHLSSGFLAEHSLCKAAH